MGGPGSVQYWPHGVYNIGAAHPGEFTHAAVLLTVRLSGILGCSRVGAGCLQIAMYGRIGIRVLFPSPDYGGTRRVTLGGVPCARGCCGLRYESVLVPNRATSNDALVGSGPEGNVWVISVTLPGRYTSGMAVSQMGDGCVRGGLPSSGRMKVSSTLCVYFLISL